MDESYGSASGLHLKVGRNRSGPNRAGPLNSYEFAGWGEMSMLEVTPGEMAAARKRVEERVVKPSSLLGQFRATAIAGNAVTGSIFYALPSIFAVAGIWTPVCLVLAALLIIPVLMIMHGLASALKSANAGSYSYLINVSSRMVALIGGSITILDAISTGAVSSATAASYVSEEAPRLSMPIFTVLFLLTLTAICLLGMRDSSTIALSMFTLHTLSIAALIIAGVVSWARTGNAVIRENWSIAAGGAELLGGKSTARALFDGTVVAFVGLTGFETTVAYAGDLKPGAFFLALRNIWVTVTLLSAPSALLVLATIPFPQILGANNILALLASSTGGRALQLVIVIDAAIVLCGGVLTGAISCTGVLLAMAKDGTLPAKLGWAIKRTGAPLWCLTTYLLLCIAMVGTASFSQITVASICKSRHL
jgi:amino acid transporter